MTLRIFLEYQTDYLMLLVSLSLVMSAVILFTLSLDWKGRLPWAWAGLFSFLQGIYWLLSMLSLSLPDPQAFRVLRIAVFVLSFLCAGEFARRGMRTLKGTAPGAWIYLPTMLAASSGLLSGMEGMDVSVRLALALPCGVAAAFLLWQKRHEDRLCARAAAGMGIFTILSAVAVHGPILGPASHVFTRFFHLAGLASSGLFLTVSLSGLSSSPKADQDMGRTRHIRWLGITLCFVLVSGWGFTEWIGKNTDVTARREILTHARIAALAINPAHIRPLKANPSDLSSKDYRRLKQQLMSMRSANSMVRFMYLMGRRDATLFFYVDSEHEGSRDYSPPGQIYRGASEEFTRAFTDGMESTEGPLNDEWGTWVSAFIPVRDPSSAKVLAVLGIDVDASDWSRKILAARRQLLLAVMLVTLIILFLSLEQRRSRLAHIRVASSERRLRYALEATSEGVWDWNIGSGAISCSPYWLSSLGYSPGDARRLGDLRKSLIHPDDRADAGETLEAHLQGRSALYECEFRMMTGDGGYRHTLDRGKVVERDPQGNPLRMVGTFTDITLRKEMEQDIRESEERLHAVFDHVQAGIILIDPRTHTIVSANRLAAKMCATTPEQMEGVVCHEFVCPSARGSCPITDFNEKMDNAERILLRTDGTMIPVLKTVILVTIGGRQYLLESFIDISDRKHAEDALLFSNQELEKTNRLLEEANLRSLEMTVRAETANNAKSLFLANMSHEIRTPMNGVIGMSELLLGTELTPRQTQYAEIIRTSGDALISIINDILDFSKIEADRIELEIIDFDLRVMLEDITELLSVRAAEKGIDLSFLIEPEVPVSLRGDPGRLRQIIMNLSGNAVKFTHEGEVVIHVGLEEDTGESLKLGFAVSDTGIGIPADKIDMLFTAFTQVDPSSTRKYGGTGLGLAISKRLVELMGGEVSVHSDEGSGSTFSFTAVFARQPAAAVPSPTHVEGLSGIRILIVDDNPTNRKVLIHLCDAWSVRHEEACCGRDALALLQSAASENDPFRIAILDAIIGDMRGEDLGRAISEDPLIRNTSLVMISSLAVRGEASRCRTAGFDAYLTKPIRQAHLFDCLRAVLGLQDAGATDGGSRRFITRHVLNEARKHDRKILLVEDNPTNRLVALGLLENLGYRADTAVNGLEALEALESTVYDLVLMDCQMPLMDGFEATSIIRDPGSPVLVHTVPIIAMTAHAMKEDRDRCLAAGMDDYLSKPIRSSDFSEMLSKWLSGPCRPTAPATGDRTADKDPAPDRLAAAEENAVVSADAFDIHDLLERLGDEDLGRAVVESLIRDLPAMLGLLGASIRGGDAEGITLHAHSIKGAAGNAGATALRDAALRMEAAGRSGDMDAAATLMPEILTHVDSFRISAEQTGWLKGGA